VRKHLLLKQLPQLLVGKRKQRHLHRRQRWRLTQELQVVHDKELVLQAFKHKARWQDKQNASVH
jgi:hypothetical protein